MPDLNKLRKDIEKKKNLEVDLPKYMNEMMTAYYRYSNIELALHFYAYSELFAEKEIQELTNNIIKVIQKYVMGEFSLDSLIENTEKLDKTRKEIIKRMETLTIYTDILKNYEYILNRIEYRVKKEAMEAFDEQEFIKKVLTFVISNRDPVILNYRTKMVIGQLPVHLTRKRYFEIIRDAFFLYKGAEKSTVDDYDYMIRTAAMLKSPEDVIRYPDLQRVIEEFQKVDFSNITKEEYDKLRSMLDSASDFIDEKTNAYLSLQELVNALYTLLLSMPYAFSDASETELCKKILSKVWDQIQTGEIDEEKITELLEKLEGKQEYLSDFINRNNYLIEDFSEEEKLIESLMLDKIYKSLKRITKLTSTSLFIDLDREKDKEMADDAYVNRICDALITDLTELFQKNGRHVRRSVMASTFEALPLFLRDFHELQEYIEMALSGCSDQREKMACVDLLEQLMKEWDIEDRKYLE